MNKSAQTTINGTQLFTFESLAVISKTKRMSRLESSPLLKNISDDPVLSMPLLHRLKDRNLQIIQELKKKVFLDVSPKSSFAAGLPLLLLDSHTNNPFST